MYDRDPQSTAAWPTPGGEDARGGQVGDRLRPRRTSVNNLVQNCLKNK